LLLPDALRNFDLADVYRAIAPRPLLVLNAQDEQTRTMPLAAAERELGVHPSLRIAVAPPETEIEIALTRWILTPHRSNWLDCAPEMGRQIPSKQNCVRFCGREEDPRSRSKPNITLSPILQLEY
jgi:hypothetical protein